MLREPLPESTTTHNERCRQLLAPDSSTTLDITACAAMLTDDRCREFLQQARDMKLQIDTHPPENPRVGAVDPHTNKEDLERGMEKHGESTRTTRVWLDSDTLSVASRKDSEATLVDLPIGHKAFSPVQDSIHRSGKDVTLSVKQIMEHDEALFSHDPNSANVQASVPGSNISTCSSADSYPSSLLKIPTLSMPGTWFGHQGLTRPGILMIDFAVGDRIIPAASSSSSPNVAFTVQLSCFRKDPHHELQEGDSLDTTLDKIRSVGGDWPATGTLVVQPQNGRSTPSLIPLRGHTFTDSSHDVGGTGSRCIRMRYLSSCRSRFLLEISIVNPL
ncbi:uncharacterized protein F5147DRAFT_703117 [Suillus discolor]|uniref:Uncharacterized protein n=1 Tax=Suillus discolor TaxID=1912936 RepID=A0A9P7F478_9AGAM|nr:uncharacterized protein F5147DRAFT_703117 [Suillus discolor]KAG2105088.1 hypothetical protein F5147DRAFT_703117 [Suillus discolor]